MRTRPDQAPARPAPPGPERGGGPAASRPATIAAGFGLFGAILVTLGPVLGVVRPDAGPAVAPAAALAIGATVAVPVLALTLLVRKAAAAAGAILAGAGAVAVGTTVLDLALWTDAIDANRLELFRPLTAAHLDPGPGAVAVVAGHLCAVIAGVLGSVAIARASQQDGYGSEHPDLDGSPVGGRIGAPAAVVAVGAGLLVAGASFGVPWTSTDPVLVVRPLLGSAAPTAIGVALVALAVLVVVASALAAGATAVAAAAVVGAGFGALSVFGSRAVVGAVAGDGVATGAGSVLAAAAAVTLILIGLLLPLVVDRRSRPATGPAPAVPTPASRQDGTPKARAAAADARARTRLGRWHAAAGLTGIGAGLLAAVGSLLPVLTLPDGVGHPQILATRVTLVAGVVLVLACVWLLLSEFAAVVRPAVGVLWAALVAAVAEVLQAWVVAADLPAVGIGPGAVLLALSALAAAATGLLAWCAGSVEREGLDMSGDAAPRAAVLAVGVPAALVSTIALALPLYTGAGDGAETVAHWPWGWGQWGRAILAVTVVLTVVVAARARPARAAVGSLGAAIAMGVYLIGWPLTSGRISEPVVGPGAWGAILGVALFAATAVVAVRPRRP
ncbi:hypothetical protein ACFYVR_12430 [Rhodococcus sp. NPDC003318]|uniref:hypothetical protein n=1 Tax=Rhodococcus sp. NPDC003318 TaxID=3364503 RepID=UPI0036CD3A1A